MAKLRIQIAGDKGNPWQCGSPWGLETDEEMESRTFRLLRSYQDERTPATAIHRRNGKAGVVHFM
jgi:hypothetical protein